MTDASLPENPIVYVNDAFCALTGYASDEVLGRNCSLLAGPETSAEIRAEMRRAVDERRPFRGRVLNYRKDGTPFWNELSIEPIADRGKAYFVAVQHDITERVALEAGLREAQKLEALGKLCGGMAHDFNNILALVMGNAEIIAAEDVGLIISEAARDIVEAADNGSDLVRRMLQSAGGQSELAEAVGVNHLIKNVVMLLGRTMGDSVAVVTDLSDAVGTVLADKTMFRTALINLALNARDAMPDGGTIRITTRRRAHLTPAIDDGVVITIADTGIGMNEDTQARAFEPFFTTKHAGRGTGLGLSMVARFVSTAGGSATIASQAGKGTTISLLLPRHTPAAAETQAREVARPRVLVVEDDPKMRKLLAQHLQRAGYAMDEAADAEEALELVETGGDYRLIISDIRLGAGKSGIELVGALRAQRPTLPIMLITAEEFDQRPSDIEGVPILRKPFRARALLDTIEQLMAGTTPAPTSRE